MKGIIFILVAVQILRSSGQSLKQAVDDSINKLNEGPERDYLVAATKYEATGRSIIQQNGGILTSSLDLSSLAKVTDGYTQGHLSQAAKYVLTEQHIKQLHTKPLTAVEFITPLAKQDPVYKEEEESFKDWYAKTPLGKKRAKATKEQINEEGREKGKKGKKGKNGKEGKKKGKKKK